MSLVGCNIQNGKCNVNHCHCCKKERHNPCICSDCTSQAGDNWVWHLREHEERKSYKPEECGLCELELESIKGK